MTEMFLVAHQRGEYDAFEERIIGVTDNYRQALIYAEKTANLINQDNSWNFYEDKIVIKKFELNKCLLTGNLRYDAGWGDRFEVRSYLQKQIYGLDNDEVVNERTNNNKLVNVEDENDWREQDCSDLSN